MKCRNPKALAEEIKQTIVGQDEHVDKIAAFIFQYLLFHYSQHGLFPLRQKPVMMLMGSSGSGKTFMIKTMAKHLGFNFIEINGAALTKSGFVGASINDFLYSKKEELTEGFDNLIYIDEFDKLCIPMGAVGTKNVSETTQAELLKVFEEEEITLKGEKNITTIPVKNACFILSGNFQEVRENKSRPMNVGFVNNEGEDNLLEKLLEKFGVIPEILGRVGLIVELNDFKKEDYEKMLMNLDGYFQTQKRVLEGLGINLEITREELDKLLDTVYNSKIGGRGLNKKIDSMIQQLFIKESDKVEAIFRYFEYLTIGEEEPQTTDIVRRDKFYPDDDDL